jgi:prolyl-tRNA synthetase
LKAKSGDIRQADKEQLQGLLGVQPGSVTPLALFNLTDKKSELHFLFDKAIQSEYVAVHPMVNTSSVFMKRDDLVKLAEGNGIKTTVIDLSVKLEDIQADAPKEEKKEKKEKVDKAAKVNEDKEKDEKVKLAVQYDKVKEFPDWYSDVITKSEMIEYYEISGCYILRPWSYQVWEIIQRFFDDGIKQFGVENAYFPLFVSERVLNKEKDHVEGFAPEVAWVTRSGDKTLENPIAIRPTSETIMYPSYSKWIRSHRDLPLKLNQWTNVVRWEFKHPTPFIRTREFLWQEGHTAHASFEESEQQVYEILDLYRRVYEELLAVPVIPGKKSENEKFAGGFYTTTVETIVPANGKAIQCATSHNLGQNFSKMFDIKYMDKEQKDQFAWQTSWGMTTRTIGVMVMVHGDNIGLILPPRIAPIQVVIVPIITSKDTPDLIIGKCKEIQTSLVKLGIKTKLDDRDTHNPGFKFGHWELKGVPLRIEFGKKDMDKNQATFVCRDNLAEKITAPLGDIGETALKLLDTVQKRLFEKAKANLEDKQKEAEDFDGFLKQLSHGNMVLTPWCNVKECEEKVKKTVKLESEKAGLDESVAGSCKTLCIPIDQRGGLKTDAKCFFCDKKAEVKVWWGRSY